MKYGLQFRHNDFDCLTHILLCLSREGGHGRWFLYHNDKKDLQDW